MKLDTITIKGFKSISHLEKISIRQINVVIGPNGSGKSNFIGAFSLLNMICEGRLQEYVAKAGGADKILHFGSKVTQSIEFHLSFNEQANEYEINLESTHSDELFSQTEISPHIKEYLQACHIYHFHDTSTLSPMKKTADINDNHFLRPDASNLSSFLYFLKKKHPESYGRIRSTIQLVTPFFDDFSLEPMKLNMNKIQLEWKHKNSDKYFDGSSLSDGTLRFMALATLFLQPEQYRSSVVLVDEPELGLHPYAITLLASIMKMASETTQIIVSTQSPLLLDYFTPEDVLVANRVDDATQFTRLNSQELESWLDEFSLGQLWEKNELGGRPASL